MKNNLSNTYHLPLRDACSGSVVMVVWTLSAGIVHSSRKLDGSARSPMLNGANERDNLVRVFRVALRRRLCPQI